ncbi:MAG: sialate O-acetylesterase [Pseudomonadota bacterium]
MRFGPSMALVAAHHWGRGTLAPTSTAPDGLLPREVAEFEDLSGWTLDSSWTATGTSVDKSSSGATEYVTRDIAIPAGEMWASYSISGATAGFIGVQFQGPFANYPFVNRVTANHVARFSGPAHTRMRMLASNTFDGSLDHLQVVPMDDLLAQPSDIYIMAGQSLMAAEQKSLPVDPKKDYWVPRCLYLPGVQNNTYGSKVDELAACTAPLQMVQASQGVSPAISFAQEIEKSTAAGRTVLILACANGGTHLVGSDAEWNPAGSVGDGGLLYGLMRDRALAALAAKPGNQIKALVWAQGESDRTGTIDVDYPPAFTSMVGQLRTDLSLPNLPVMILGPMPDDQTAVQPLFISTQEKLDQDSGDPTAVSGVHYVARESGYISSDGTHPEPEGNRLVGRAAAQRFVALNYV